MTTEPHKAQPEPVVPQPAAPQPPQPQPIIPPAYVSQPAAASNGLAIAALVVGIIAFLFGWIGALDLLAAITAVILGGIALAKKQNKGLAITGLVLGAVALITALIMTIIWLVALTSAANDTAKEVSNMQSTQQAVANAEHDFTKGTVADFYDISVVATNVEHGITDTYVKPAAGNELVRVTVSIKNISDSKISVSPYDFEVSADGVSTMRELVSNDSQLDAVSLESGASVSGTMVFEVKVGASLKLNYSTYDSTFTKQDYSLAL